MGRIRTYTLLRRNEDDVHNALLMLWIAILLESKGDKWMFWQKIHLIANACVCLPFFVDSSTCIYLSLHVII